MTGGRLSVWYSLGTVASSLVVACYATAYVLPYWIVGSSCDSNLCEWHHVGLWNGCFSRGLVDECRAVDAAVFIGGTPKLSAVSSTETGPELTAARVLGAVGIAAALVPVFVHSLLACTKCGGRRAVFEKQTKLRLRLVVWVSAALTLLTGVAVCVVMGRMAGEFSTIGACLWVMAAGWACSLISSTLIDRKMVKTALKEVANARNWRHSSPSLMHPRHSSGYELAGAAHGSRGTDRPASPCPQVDYSVIGVEVGGDHLHAPPQGGYSAGGSDGVPVAGGASVLRNAAATRRIEDMRVTADAAVAAHWRTVNGPTTGTTTTGSTSTGNSKTVSGASLADDTLTNRYRAFSDESVKSFGSKDGVEVPLQLTGSGSSDAVSDGRNAVVVDASGVIEHSTTPLPAFGATESPNSSLLLGAEQRGSTLTPFAQAPDAGGSSPPPIRSAPTSARGAANPPVTPIDVVGAVSSRASTLQPVAASNHKLHASCDSSDSELDLDDDMKGAIAELSSGRFEITLSSEGIAALDRAGRVPVAIPLAGAHPNPVAAAGTGIPKAPARPPVRPPVLPPGVGVSGGTGTGTSGTGVPYPLRPSLAVGLNPLSQIRERASSSESNTAESPPLRTPKTSPATTAAFRPTSGLGASPSSPAVGSRASTGAGVVGGGGSGTNGNYSSRSSGSSVTTPQHTSPRREPSLRAADAPPPPDLVTVLFAASKARDLAAHRAGVPTAPAAADSSVATDTSATSESGSATTATAGGGHNYRHTLSSGLFAALPRKPSDRRVSLMSLGGSRRSLDADPTGAPGIDYAALSQFSVGSGSGSGLLSRPRFPTGDSEVVFHPSIAAPPRSIASSKRHSFSIANLLGGRASRERVSSDAMDTPKSTHSATHTVTSTIASTGATSSGTSGAGVAPVAALSAASYQQALRSLTEARPEEDV